MAETAIRVDGMHCRSCEMLLSEVLNEISGVKVVSADHKKGRIIVDADAHLIPAAKAAIEKEGYRVVSP